MSSSEDELSAAFLVGCYFLLRNKKKRRKKRQQKCLKQIDSGHSTLPLLHEEQHFDDKTAFKNILRMNEDCFMLLVSKVEHKIRHKDTNFKESVTPRKRLSITLRFLATGESFKSLSCSFRAGRTTIGLIVLESINAIFECMKDEYIKVPRTEEEWFRIGKEFEEKWNFPNCCGALHGKHINLKPPKTNESASIVLLAAVDANSKFIYVDAGTNGRVIDEGVFYSSHLSTAISNNIYNIPESVLLPGSNVPAPFVFVANDTFPLNCGIMKPFCDYDLSHEQKVYNYRLNRARNVAENAFGILASRFKILSSPIHLQVQKVERITVVCCIIHNFLSKYSKHTYLNQENEEPANLTNMTRLGDLRSPSRRAIEIRNTFVHYFNNVGAVPWQNDCINIL